MQKSHTSELSIIKDKEMIREIISLTSEEFYSIIYAIGCQEFEERMWSWPKNILTQIIKANRKVQVAEKEEQKSDSLPVTEKRSDSSTYDSDLPELFKSNLRTLLIDLDWDDITKRLQRHLDISNLQPENESKQSSIIWYDLK